MSAARLEPGAIIRYDGEVWTVAGLSGLSVRLRRGVEACVVLTSEVVGAADFAVMAHADGSSPDVVRVAELAGLSALDHLSKSERKKYEKRLRAVLWMRDGGFPGEPPDAALLASSGGARERLIAARLDTTDRSVRGWMAQFAELGPAGLINPSEVAHGRPVGRIDPPYRVAIGEVLAAVAPKSKITDVYLVEQVQARVAAYNATAENPVKVRSGRTVKRYLHELKRGRGSTCRRSQSTRSRIGRRVPGAACVPVT